MTLGSRSRRRRWLVARRYQLRFALLLALQVTAVLSAGGLLAILLGRQAASRVGAFAREHDAREVADQAANASRLFLAEVVAVVFVGLVTASLYGVRSSRRLAGPVHRLERVLAEVGAGNTSQRVAFRRPDRLGDLAKTLNRRIGQLDDAQSRLKAGIPFLASSLQTLRNDIEGGKFPLDEDELRRLDASLKGLLTEWHGEPSPRRGAP
jgi:methyl-accepting chemotaxis protein